MVWFVVISILYFIVSIWYIHRLREEIRAYEQTWYNIDEIVNSKEKI